ncbi:hypothetical protein D9758_008631 [Tetrapyrgos nigripes]|uniref:Sortilin N-terminal domain-containing protein n=1 Tax=Tetrapyrgos nigripes TaxID=182062 RepID=A0A8H5D7N8_9AGAR|nr:hypothetical protein D9758_008631 [Tetrapyrgos nigripes]
MYRLNLACVRSMASASATAYFVFCFYFLLSSVAAQQPKITLSLFETLPNHFFFFENASNVAYFDAVHGNVYVSQDEGKSWVTANGIPRHEAVKFVAHPFEKRLAFVLTDSTRHYRTDDEGKTWMPFDIPVPPSRTSNPLSFHAKHPGYILYQGGICHDQVCYYDEVTIPDSSFDEKWAQRVKMPNPVWTRNLSRPGPPQAEARPRFGHNRPRMWWTIGLAIH